MYTMRSKMAVCNYSLVKARRIAQRIASIIASIIGAIIKRGRVRQPNGIDYRNRFVQERF